MPMQCDDCVHSTHMLSVGLVLVLHAGFGLAQPRWGSVAPSTRQGEHSFLVGSQAGFIAGQSASVLQSPQKLFAGFVCTKQNLPAPQSMSALHAVQTFLVTSTASW